MPPAPTPFLGSSYIARSQTLAAQTAVNVYIESVEAKDGRAPAAFYGRPGLNLISALSGLGGPVRGLHAQESNLWIVAGSDVWLAVLSGNAWTLTLIGTIGTAIGPIWWMDNGTQVALTDGVNGWIVFNQPFKLLSGSGGTSENFMRIGHTLLALLIAFLGGRLSRALSAAGLRPRSDTPAEPARQQAWSAPASSLEPGGPVA